MKKFNELSKEQQKKAIEMAKIEMRDCVGLGLILFPKGITKSEMDKCATEAAMCGLYTDDGMPAPYELPMELLHA